MKIAIIGGGNIGTLMGAEFAARGHSVALMVSDPQNWSYSIDIFNREDEILETGRLDLVTNRLEEAVRGADYVWVTYPTFAMESLANRLLPYVVPGMRIGVVPGNNGEFFFAQHIAQGAALFGLQRVHSIARIKQRGSSVYELGRKDELQVAALPSKLTSSIAHDLRDMFAMPVVELPNYLVETLTPSNPILHTTRIRSMFRDWEPGITYDRNFLFYEEWDMDSSDLLLACDDELQATCRVLEDLLGFDLSRVHSLRYYYDSPDSAAMTAKISSIAAFKGISSPMMQIESGRWVPDFYSRYFKADFAFGLRSIRDIAALVGVRAERIDEVYDWYLNASGDTTSFDAVPKTIEEFASLYR